MSWFDRSRAERSVDEAHAALDAAVANSGLLDALHRASGPYGLRRWAVRFERRGGRARLVGVDAAPLPRGGGPPASSAFDGASSSLTTALDALHRALPPGFTFERGVVGFTRGADGAPTVSLRFDEDADGFRLDELPTPRGEPHPLEDPAFVRALVAWDTRMAALRGRWIVARGAWSLREGWLTFDERRVRATPIATWRAGRFVWSLDRPAGEEAPMVEPELDAPLSEAPGLVALAAAREGHDAVFQGTIEDGAQLWAGVRERG